MNPNLQRILMGRRKSVVYPSPPFFGNVRRYYDVKDKNTQFEFSTGNTLATSNIGRWVDKGSDSIDLIQSSSARRPVLGTRFQNSIGTVDFPGVNQFMQDEASSVLNQPNSYAFVAKIDSSAAAPNDRYIFDGGVQRQAVILEGNYRIFSGSGPVTGQSVDFTQYCVFLAEFNGALSRLYVNGVLRVSGNSGSNSLNTLFLGSRTGGSANYFDGALGDFIVYNTVFDNAGRNSICGHLSSVWNIPVSIIT